MDVSYSPYCHTDRVTAAIEKTILTEKARTLGLVIKDVRLIQRHIAKAEAEGGPGVTINPNILSDNDNSNKDNGVLQIRQVRASCF